MPIAFKSTSLEIRINGIKNVQYSSRTWNRQGQFGAHVVGIYELFLQRRCFTESMIFAARV